MKNENKQNYKNEWKLMMEAEQEIYNWSNHLKKNSELLFEEERDKQRKCNIQYIQDLEDNCE